MTHKLARCLVLAVGLLVICGTMRAHHGEASTYDHSHRITVKATMAECLWANPHVQLYIDLKNDKGENERWGLVLVSPGSLVSEGIYKTTFKVGDVVLVSFTPSFGDRPYGNCAHILHPDGSTLYTKPGHYSEFGSQCFGGNDISKLPVKPGYTAVEYKNFPKDPPQGRQPRPQG